MRRRLCDIARVPLLFIMGAGWLVCLSAFAQSPQPLQLEFSPRVLEDGSETFDVLMRNQDGLFVYGCVRKPSGPGPFPGVILVHGGFGGSPGVTRNTALAIATSRYLVKNGYALLSTDYRAGDWITEYKEVIAAFEFFKTQAYVKPDTIGVLGGSHGGNLAIQLAKHVPVRAAVACSGLHDLARLYEYIRDSEFHRKQMSERRGSVGEVYLRETTAQLGGTPAELPDEYRTSSAIHELAQVQAPVLIVHGIQDLVVPVDISVNLAAELKKHGKEVESYFPVGGPHGFYWGRSGQGAEGVSYDPTENQEFLARLLAFLRKHLE